MERIYKIIKPLGFRGTSMYLMEVSLSVSVFIYLWLVSLGSENFFDPAQCLVVGSTPFPGDVPCRGGAALALMAIPAVLTIIGWLWRAKGRRWITLRSVTTMTYVVGFLFLGVFDILAFGIVSFGWLSFLLVAVVSAICHINVRVDKDYGCP